MTGCSRVPGSYSNAEDASRLEGVVHRENFVGQPTLSGAILSSHAPQSTRRDVFAYFPRHQRLGTSRATAR
jgi:hypothetical protein